MKKNKLVIKNLFHLLFIMLNNEMNAKHVQYPHEWKNEV